MENESRGDLFTFMHFFQRNMEKKTKHGIFSLDHVIWILVELVCRPSEHCRAITRTDCECHTTDLHKRRARLEELWRKLFCWFSTLTTLWIAHKGKVQNMKLGKVGFQMFTCLHWRFQQISRRKSFLERKPKIWGGNMCWRTKKFVQHNTAETKSWCLKSEHLGITFNEFQRRSKFTFSLMKLSNIEGPFWSLNSDKSLVSFCRN